jgi:hypothetical protein
MRLAGSNPSLASERYQTKDSSSLIRMSGSPSPSRSTKRRFGSWKSTLGSAGKVRKGSKSSSMVRVA